MVGTNSLQMINIDVIRSNLFHLGLATVNNNNNKMFLYSAVPVRGSAQCAIHTKRLLKVLKSGKACLKVICVYKKMGFQVLFEMAQCRT